MVARLRWAGAHKNASPKRSHVLYNMAAIVTGYLRFGPIW